MHAMTGLPPETTMKPDTAESGNGWIPYVAASVVLVCLLIFALFCCCKRLREMCCGKKEVTRRDPSNISSLHGKSMRSSIRPGGSSSVVPTYTVRSGDLKSTSLRNLKKLSSMTPNSTRKTEISKFLSSRPSVGKGPASRGPSSRPSSSRQLSGSKPLSASSKSRSRSRSSSSSRKGSSTRSASNPRFSSPSSAPPAAKQVTRTAKIIGNILTHSGSTRKQ